MFDPVAAEQHSQKGQRPRRRHRCHLLKGAAVRPGPADASAACSGYAAGMAAPPVLFADEVALRTPPQHGIDLPPSGGLFGGPPPIHQTPRMPETPGRNVRSRPASRQITPARPAPSVPKWGVPQLSSYALGQDEPRASASSTAHTTPEHPTNGSGSSGPRSQLMSAAPTPPVAPRAPTFTAPAYPPPLSPVIAPRVPPIHSTPTRAGGAASTTGDTNGPSMMSLDCTAALHRSASAPQLHHQGEHLDPPLGGTDTTHDPATLSFSSNVAGGVPGGERYAATPILAAAGGGVGLPQVPSYGSMWAFNSWAGVGPHAGAPTPMSFTGAVVSPSRGSAGGVSRSHTGLVQIVRGGAIIGGDMTDDDVHSRSIMTPFDHIAAAPSVHPPGRAGRNSVSLHNDRVTPITPSVARTACPRDITPVNPIGAWDRMTPSASASINNCPPSTHPLFHAPCIPTPPLASNTTTSMPGPMASFALGIATNPVAANRPVPPWMSTARPASELQTTTAPLDVAAPPPAAAPAVVEAAVEVSVDAPAPLAISNLSGSAVATGSDPASGPSSDETTAAHSPVSKVSDAAGAFSVVHASGQKQHRGHRAGAGAHAVSQQRALVVRDGSVAVRSLEASAPASPPSLPPSVMPLALPRGTLVEGGAGVGGDGRGNASATVVTVPGVSPISDLTTADSTALPVQSPGGPHTAVNPSQVSSIRAGVDGAIVLDSRRLSPMYNSEVPVPEDATTMPSHAAFSSSAALPADTPGTPASSPQVASSAGGFVMAAASAAASVASALAPDPRPYVVQGATPAAAMAGFNSHMATYFSSLRKATTLARDIVRGAAFPIVSGAIPPHHVNRADANGTEAGGAAGLLLAALAEPPIDPLAVVPTSKEPMVGRAAPVGGAVPGLFRHGLHVPWHVLLPLLQSHTAPVPDPACTNISAASRGAPDAAASELLLQFLYAVRAVEHIPAATALRHFASADDTLTSGASRQRRVNRHDDSVLSGITARSTAGAGDQASSRSPGDANVAGECQSLVPIVMPPTIAFVPLYTEVNGTTWLGQSKVDGAWYAVKEVPHFALLRARARRRRNGRSASSIALGGISLLRRQRDRADRAVSDELAALLLAGYEPGQSPFIVRYLSVTHDAHPARCTLQTEYFPAGSLYQYWTTGAPLTLQLGVDGVAEAALDDFGTTRSRRHRFWLLPRNSPFLARHAALIDVVALALQAERGQLAPEMEAPRWMPFAARSVRDGVLLTDHMWWLCLQADGEVLQGDAGVAVYLPRIPHELEVVSALQDAAMGLAALHFEGLIHNNLAASSLFVDTALQRVRVGCFGAARRLRHMWGWNARIAARLRREYRAAAEGKPPSFADASHQAGSDASFASDWESCSTCGGISRTATGAGGPAADPFRLVPFETALPPHLRPRELTLADLARAWSSSLAAEPEAGATHASSPTPSCSSTDDDEGECRRDAISECPRVAGCQLPCWRHLRRILRLELRRWHRARDVFALAAGILHASWRCAVQLDRCDIRVDDTLSPVPFATDPHSIRAIAEWCGFSTALTETLLAMMHPDYACRPTAAAVAAAAFPVAATSEAGSAADVPPAPPIDQLQFAVEEVQQLDAVRTWNEADVREEAKKREWLWRWWARRGDVTRSPMTVAAAVAPSSLAATAPSKMAEFALRQLQHFRAPPQASPPPASVSVSGAAAGATVDVTSDRPLSFFSDAAGEDTTTSMPIDAATASGPLSTPAGRNAGDGDAPCAMRTPGPMTPPPVFQVLPRSLVMGAGGSDAPSVPIALTSLGGDTVVASQRTRSSSAIGALEAAFQPQQLNSSVTQTPERRPSGGFGPPLGPVHARHGTPGGYPPRHHDPRGRNSISTLIGDSTQLDMTTSSARRPDSSRRDRGSHALHTRTGSDRILPYNTFATPSALAVSISSVRSDPGAGDVYLSSTALASGRHSVGRGSVRNPSVHGSTPRVTGGTPSRRPLVRAASASSRGTAPVARGSPLLNSTWEQQQNPNQDAHGDSVQLLASVDANSYHLVDPHHVQSSTVLRTEDLARVSNAECAFAFLHAVYAPLTNGAHGV